MEICSYSQTCITYAHKIWISLIAFSEQILRLREWPAMQERCAHICIVVTIKWHYTFSYMQLEICQSSSIHSISSFHDAKPGPRRKMLFKKKKTNNKLCSVLYAFTEHLTFQKAFQGS